MARTVAEIRSRELFSVRPDDAVDEALDGILALGVSGAPVLDPEGRPIGTVSLRNLVGRRPGDRVADRMTTPAVTAPETRQRRGGGPPARRDRSAPADRGGRRRAGRGRRLDARRPARPAGPAERPSAPLPDGRARGGARLDRRAAARGADAARRRRRARRAGADPGRLGHGAAHRLGRGLRQRAHAAPGHARRAPDRGAAARRSG